MRRITDVRCRAQAGPQESHQQRRRHALAGHVGDDDADLILEKTRPVIVVAGNFFGRKVVSADIKTVEAMGRERADDLAHPVGAVVETEDPVAVPDAWRTLDDPCFDEFIRFTCRVGLLDCGQGIGRRHTDTFHHRIVRQFRPLPSLIPIHRVVPPNHRRDGGPFAQRSYGLQEVFHESERRFRRRISAIEPGVNRDG